MARGEQLGRQWKMLQKLLSDRNGRTATELAEELDCHPRTVYRDLEALQIAGFPLYTDRVDGKNRWLLMENARRQAPLPLNLAELMALYFGRRILELMGGTLFSEALESLFAKIRATLPAETAAYVDRMADTLHVAPGPYKASGRIGEVLKIINGAILENKELEIVYFTMSRQQESLRQVAPYKIWFFNGSFYLIGYCRQRADIRVFALERVRSLKKTSQECRIPVEFDAGRFMENSFGVFVGKKASVHIRFSPAVAGYIRERTWHENQVLTEGEDGSLDFEATVAGTEEIKFWALSWGRHAEVLAPLHLRQEMLDEVRAMGRRYEMAGLS